MAAEISPSEKQAIVVGIDEGEHSEYALQWTLDHFFGGATKNFDLIVVYARPFATAVVGMGSPGVVDVLPFVESNLRTIAAGIAERVKEICESKSFRDAVIETVEGDARDVLCEAVKRHSATILVLGSHGYGAFKRAFLGSVSDYCVHEANCNVLIVNKPNPTN